MINACLRASADDDLSLEYFFGLKNGVSAPYFALTFFIFILSVETI